MIVTMCLQKHCISIDCIDYVTKIGNSACDVIELNDDSKTHLEYHKMN